MIFTCLACLPSENNFFPNLFSFLRLSTLVVECDHGVLLPNLYLWCNDWSKDRLWNQTGS